MISNVIKKSKTSLKGNYKNAFLAMIILFFVSCFLAEANFLLMSVVVVPLSCGILKYFLNLVKGEQKLTDLVAYYIDYKQGIKLILAYILMMIIVMFGLCLLIVPGIIWAYRYAMVFYLMIEDNDISIEDAFKKSREMMKGHKFELFLLEMRVILLQLVLIIGGTILFIIAIVRDSDTIKMADINISPKGIVIEEESVNIGEDIDIEPENTVVSENNAEETVDKDLLVESPDYDPNCANPNDVVNLALIALGYILICIGTIWVIFMYPLLYVAYSNYYFELKEKATK